MTGAVEDVHPLAPPQAGVLLRCLTEPEPGLYVVQMRFELTGAVHVGRLQAAWTEMVRRHPVLRSAVVWEGVSHPVQVVVPPSGLTVPVDVFDVRDVAAGDRAAAVQDILREDRVRGFDLTRAPLMRVLLVQLGEQLWEMVWTHHHVILDGWSAAHVVAELWQCYGGHDAPAAKRPAFRDYTAAVAAKAALSREANTRYWTGVVRPHSGRRPLLDEENLPRSHWAPDIWSEREHPVPDDRLQPWLNAARRHRVSLPTLLQAGWALTLRTRGLGPDEVTYGLVTSTRTDVPDGTEVVGMCVTSVPQRVVMDPGVDVSAWLRRVAGDTAAAEEHACVNPADHRLWSGGDTTAEPFRCLLAIENYPQEALLTRVETDGIGCRYLGVRESTNYALTAGVPAGSPKRLKLTFDTRRVRAERVVALLDLWHTAVDLLCAEEPCTLGDVLAALDQRGAGPDNSGSSVLSLIAGQVAALPGAVAVSDAVGSLTFHDLDAAADRVAAWLCARGTVPGERVGVMAGSSRLTVAAALGALRAGAAYVPVDPRHPAPYRAAVVADAGVRLVLSSARRCLPELPGATVLYVPDILSAPETPVVPSPPGGRRTEAEAEACVAYTSGTAHAPVGVSYSHSDLTAALKDMAELLDTGPGETWAPLHSLARAAAPWEWWAPLAHGGRLLLPPAVVESLPETAARLVEERVSVVMAAPAEVETVRRLIRRSASWPGPRGLRTLVNGRGPADADLRGWRAEGLPSGVRLASLYAPAGTGAALARLLTPADLADEGGAAALGHPGPGTAVVVLGPAGEPVSPDAVGELHLGARTLLPTGDLVRVSADGLLTMTGRADDRVPVRGVLVRPEDVETLIKETCPEVADCRVAVPPAEADAPPSPTAEGDGLVACLVPKEPFSQGPAQRVAVERALLRALRSRLPETSVPTALRWAEFPAALDGRTAVDIESAAALRAASTPSGAQDRKDIEDEITSVWGAVLDVPDVPLDARFFDLGGNSLLLFKVLTLLRRKGWNGLTMADLFACPTPRGLADHLPALRGRGPATPEPPVPDRAAETESRQVARGRLADRRRRGRS
ncbi:condensation domain-containing protein [Streptomyces alanosinicus]|uniref:Carrier domain-containing protein n=1 Tax=Streptomyces alanosinicus TaxID=68171 RepID=A0A918YK48_9ACTN|nr:condensation domain-containing protein [Streptomyces alanosinicus]GHE06682.1 hypothetical protein GCM10010339_48500 [Streptomyces alanosinicus]